MDGNAQQWGDEVKETKAQNDELKDVGSSSSSYSSISPTFTSQSSLHFFLT